MAVEIVILQLASAVTPNPSIFAVVDLSVRIFTLLLVGASAVLAYNQIKKTQEWNRRKATQDLLFQVATGDLKEFVQALSDEFGVDLTKTMPLPSYQSVVENEADDKRQDRVRHLTRSILNYMETIAIGLKNHVLDEDICYEHLSIWMTEYWSFSDKLIKIARAKNPTVWIEQEHYVNLWRSRLDRENESLRRPGKSRT